MYSKQKQLLGQQKVKKPDIQTNPWPEAFEWAGEPAMTPSKTTTNLITVPRMIFLFVSNNHMS